MAKKWIRKAKLKKGTLSRQLDIPEEDDIPITLLRAIRDADIGDTIKNPTKMGKQKIKVTRLLKKRAVLAITLKGI
jgi:hypothetical protein